MNGLIGRTISHYHVLAEIGQGGMSSVFRATDLVDGRPVALKILSPYIAHEERFRARFEREIKLLRRLQHPNIVPILDFGEADGVTFIVMPFYSGGTLLDRLNEGPLDPREGGAIVNQLSSALMLAHQNGVVHRDVKPSNVLMDDEGNALLSDFSFARSQDASQNLTGSALIGTPAYMSPEQCRGEPIDARSDQYSFAVMLFQITTGSLPFTGDTPMATAMQHMNVPLPRPRSVNPNLPDEVELVLIKALAKDPSLRFDSVEAMNRAFQTAIAVALDPALRASAGKTISANRTLAMYRKYQNIKPPNRSRPYERSAILATLLLLLACTVSAGAVAILRPDLPLFVAAADQPLSEDELQGTVDARVADALAAGTVVSADELATRFYATVLVIVEETRVAAGLPSSTPSETPTPTQTTFGGGIATPTPTQTYPPWVTPPTPTRTRTLSPGEPSPTPTPTRTSTGSASDTPSDTPTPTDTSAPPTDTSVPPTDTPVPPTNTPAPPTDTLEPTPTKTPRCRPNGSGGGGPPTCTPSP